MQGIHHRADFRLRKAYGARSLTSAIGARVYRLAISYNPVDGPGSIVLVDCAVNRQLGLLSGDLKLGVRERLCDCLRKCLMKLYVGNLSFSTGESELRDLFTPHGTVTDVYLATDRMSGDSRGFAFVTIGNRSEGQAAINAMEGQSVDGRNLTVNEARPKTEHKPARSFSGRR